MTHPATTRELLIAETLGEAATLIERVEALAPALDASRQALAEAHQGLADQLAAFEGQVAAITDRAKVQTVKHILARTDEAARRSIELQSRAMADAARVALGAEFGAALERLKAVTAEAAHRSPGRWEPWLTHAAAAVAASALTWAAAAWLCAG
jgi:hypothetical protein